MPPTRCCSSRGWCRRSSTTEPGSDLWRERLAFRDRLRCDPDLAAEYQQLKHNLSRRFPADGAAYAAGKRDFVARVLARSGIFLTGRPARSTD